MYHVTLPLFGRRGLLSVRREGTRTFLRLAETGRHDVVVADAVESGRRICESDGSLARVAAVLSGRDATVREFFSKLEADQNDQLDAYAPEVGAYLSALAPLLPRRYLAVDAGTGDGRLLDVLAPLYRRVIAIDRSETQLVRAQRRMAARGHRNVEWFQGELDAKDVRQAAGAGADAVFAVRLLHHASRPAFVMKILADLCAPGGALVVLDYAGHNDESMQKEADLWLGFAPHDLTRFASDAGLSDVEVRPIPPGLRGAGVDAHLPWQVMVARKASGAPVPPKT